MAMTPLMSTRIHMKCFSIKVGQVVENQKVIKMVTLATHSRLIDLKIKASAFKRDRLITGLMLLSTTLTEMNCKTRIKTLLEVKRAVSSCLEIIVTRTLIQILKQIRDNSLSLKTNPSSANLKQNIFSQSQKMQGLNEELNIKQIPKSDRDIDVEIKINGVSRLQQIQLQQNLQISKLRNQSLNQVPTSKKIKKDNSSYLNADYSLRAQNRSQLDQITKPDLLNQDASMNDLNDNHKHNNSFQNSDEKVDVQKEQGTQTANFPDDDLYKTLNNFFSNGLSVEIKLKQLKREIKPRLKNKFKMGTENNLSYSSNTPSLPLSSLVQNTQPAQQTNETSQVIEENDNLEHEEDSSWNRESIGSVLDTKHYLEPINTNIQNADVSYKLPQSNKGVSKKIDEFHKKLGSFYEHWQQQYQNEYKQNGSSTLRPFGNEYGIIGSFTLMQSQNQQLLQQPTYQLLLNKQRKQSRFQKYLHQIQYTVNNQFNNQ
ncbi:UNKNOWN [Stylonychia lemnae]|uniref:Uncharacterized protein n=1 Tax=Stylonychia lemnae TaxID=5949 RepID=A0A077ZV08_STYLE|nr:UNKNOWN [Stylonychia lemnae]|eukprot:CDW73135.1 UNKNOWN [Stylonychia lemnae]